MAGLLIVAHAPLASALRQVAGHVFAEQLAQVGAVDVDDAWGPEALEQAVREAMGRLGGTQILILTDVFGATPCNVSQRLADGVDVRVVTGANVPMLWRLLAHLGEPLDSLVARAVAGGGQGVMQVAVQRPQNQALHARLHDQSHAHHQQ